LNTDFKRENGEDKELEEGEERGRNRIQYRNERPYITVNNNHNNTRLMACFPGQPG